jgi:hypothetical protein
MSTTAAEEISDPEYLQLLDDLILGSYRGLKKQLEESPPKLGEFLKMIEMRLKAVPTGAHHRRFWEMLEEIRRNTLPDSKQSETLKPSSRDEEPKK